MAAGWGAKLAGPSFYLARRQLGATRLRNADARSTETRFAFDKENSPAVIVTPPPAQRLTLEPAHCNQQPANHGNIGKIQPQISAGWQDERADDK